MRTGSSRGDGYRLINLLYRNLEAKGFLLSSSRDIGCPTAEEVELKSDIMCPMPAVKNTSKRRRNKDAFSCPKKSELLAKYLLTLRSKQLVPMQAMMHRYFTLSKTTRKPLID